MKLSRRAFRATPSTLIAARRTVYKRMLVAIVAVSVWPWLMPAQIGSEKAILRHLRDGEEFEIGIEALLKHGEALFAASWTIQEGAGRPLTKGTGAPLSDLASPLVFPRNFNRISAPDSNSCAGCHAVPRIGGGGDIVANVFVLGQRFDFATFDAADARATKGTADELGRPASLQSIANERATIGMFGSGSSLSKLGLWREIAREAHVAE